MVLNITKAKFTADATTRNVGWDMRGNMDLQLIRINKGRTIMIQHDISSPRPYSKFTCLVELRLYTSEVYVFFDY